MMKDRELELNFPRVSFFMLRWQALTVTAVIPIVWLDFSKICLPHPSTTVSLMVCRFAKFLPKRKTYGRTRHRPSMTDFHRKVHKFWQRFPKCDPYLCYNLPIYTEREVERYQAPNEYSFTGEWLLRAISPCPRPLPKKKTFTLMTKKNPLLKFPERYNQHLCQW